MARIIQGLKQQVLDKCDVYLSKNYSAMTSHEEFISRVYCLAREAQANGDHPFVALLVLDGVVTLECLNTVNTSADATRHPELDILRLAAHKTGKE